MIGDMATQPYALNDWLICDVNRLVHTEVDSVAQWLEDLRMMTETECMCVLQGKSLTKDPADVVFTTAKTTKDRIDNIRTRAHIISSEFSKLFRKVEKERWKHVKTGCLRLTCTIRALLHECTSSMAQHTREFSQHQQRVMEACAKLAQHVESNCEVNGHKPDGAAIVKLMTQLGQAFANLTDMVLGSLIQKMLQSLDNTENGYSITSTINNLVSLGLEGEHICYLIAKEGGIRTLLEICQKETLRYAHGPALRAVATICCVSASIVELEKVGGVECLSDILSDNGSIEAVRAEAAGVVAQITSPCLQHYHHLQGFIENMDDLVRSLTNLCLGASSHEVFLLGAAALANMTFMDSMACDFLSQYNTAAALIEACHLDKAHSLFAKDQVATVLANMVAVDGCYPDIVENHGLELLVQFLQEKVAQYEAEAERSACERVQQKAAIALSRLSKDPHTAQHVVQLNAIPRLVQLCREPKERSHSDAVLVACLAALRKISSVCALEDFKNHEDLQQLIQPKLMDSFLICSNLDESFV